MPLHLVLEPSPRLGLFIGLIHALAGFAALANPLPFWARFGLFAMVGASGFLSLRRHRHPGFSGLVLDADEGWQVIGRSGAVPARLAESTVVTRWMVLLHLETDTGKIALAICRDSIDPESFRRLRVALRCRGGRDAARPEARAS